MQSAPVALEQEPLSCHDGPSPRRMKMRAIRVACLPLKASMCAPCVSASCRLRRPRLASNRGYPFPRASSLTPGWPGQLVCPGREATGGGCQDVRTSGEGLPVAASCNTRTKHKQFRCKTFALLDKPAVAPAGGMAMRLPRASGLSNHAHVYCHRRHRDTEEPGWHAQNVPSASARRPVETRKDKR